tara:strand:+ start:494 stop:643 length:150 start_codon:yes stop_codon:yes gene_type:complete
MTPSEYKDFMIDKLENLNYSDNQLIESFVRFLNISQLEDLKDSIDRELF